jgi:nucleoside-diphosphate-sugar epimerase
MAGNIDFSGDWCMKGCQGKKILISGGENCLGKNVAGCLARQGARVCLVGDDAAVRGTAENDGQLYIKAGQLDDIEKILGSPDIILYLDHPEMFQNDLVDIEFPGEHLKGLINLLRLAGKYSSHFMYASSSAVYGRQKYLPIDENHPLDPILLYGTVKMAGEYICRSKAMEEGFFYTILRYGDVYGPGVCCGEPFDFIAGSVGGKTLFVNGAGGQVRSYIFIDDAVEATIKAVIYKPYNQIVNLAGDEYISIWHLASLIKQKYCQKCEIRIANSILLDDVECCLDSGRAKELFNFLPKVDLNAGLSITYHWFLSQIKR